MPIPSTHISLLCDICEGRRRDESWAAFHARYGDLILAWCLRRGLPPDRAEDLTQDVLLKLFERLPQYRHDPGRGQFRGWLKTVVNNTLADFWRRQQRQPEGPAVGGTAFLNRVASLATPEAADELSGVIEDRAGAALERVRAKLKETTWQAFYQSLVEGRPAAEVAAGLGVSVASVYKATYRVKRMLLEESGRGDTNGEPNPLPKPRDPESTPA